MGKLYGVALVSKEKMRDIKIESILRESKISDDIHVGEIDFVFEYDNIINHEVSKRCKVYKTLNGANRFKEKCRYNCEFILRYSFKKGGCKLPLSLLMSFEIVIIDITDKWDLIIDNEITLKTEKFDKEISKLLQKKSK